MGNYTIFLQFENPRRGRQARNLSENDPKILDLKSSSEQIIFRKLSLGAPEKCSNCRVTSLSVPFPILRYFPPTGCIYKSRCFDSDFFLKVLFSVEEGGERPDFGWLSIRATLFSFCSHYAPDSFGDDTKTIPDTEFLRASESCVLIGYATGKMRTYRDSYF